MSINNQPIHVARAAQYTHISLISMILVIMLKNIAATVIFTFDLIFPIPAWRLKFICNKKLKTKNKIAYCRIVPELINFSQKSVNAITSANTKKNILNINPTEMKISENTFFILAILLKSHVPCNSAITGNSRANIGPIIMKGMPIILR